MAGQWKTPPTDRKNIATKMCQTWIWSKANRSASTKVVSATLASAIIITTRRFKRSTIAPVNGASKTSGRMATIVAVANKAAEPVFWVIHQTRANCTNPLPNKEKI